MCCTKKKERIPLFHVNLAWSLCKAEWFCMSRDRVYLIINYNFQRKMRYFIMGFVRNLWQSDRKFQDKFAANVYLSTRTWKSERNRMRSNIIFVISKRTDIVRQVYGIKECRSYSLSLSLYRSFWKNFKTLFVRLWNLSYKIYSLII